MKTATRQPRMDWWDFCRQIAFGSADHDHSYRLLVDQFDREHPKASQAERDDAHRRIAQLCGV